jgi:hypothetical protein
MSRKDKQQNLAAGLDVRRRGPLAQSVISVPIGAVPQSRNPLKTRVVRGQASRPMPTEYVPHRVRPYIPKAKKIARQTPPPTGTIAELHGNQAPEGDCTAQRIRWSKWEGRKEKQRLKATTLYARARLLVAKVEGSPPKENKGTVASVMSALRRIAASF